MKLVAVPVSARGVDTDTILTASRAQAFAASKIDWVARYLGQVTPAEIALIHTAGLGVQLVTYSRAPGWKPTAAMGTADGVLDVQRLRSLGVLAGMVVWIDLEGSAGTSGETAAWLDARALELTHAGFVAGVYVGSSCVLDAVQLYARPNISRYWRAFNAGIPIPQCGFCQEQLFPPNLVLDGVLVDFDVSRLDYEKRAATMLVADEWASPLPVSS